MVSKALLIKDSCLGTHDICGNANSARQAIAENKERMESM